MTDAKHQKIVTKGASGSATVLANKSTANIKLEPVGENALAGSGSYVDLLAMTMVFRVHDAAMVDPVKEGGKIKFVTVRINAAEHGHTP